MAAVTSSQVSKRRPARASERRIYHHGSIRLRYAARLEHHLPARVRQQEQQRVGGAVTAQVVRDGIDPPNLLRQPWLDRLQEGHPVGRATARVGMREGSARGRAESLEDRAFAAPAIVDLLPGAACRRRVRSNQIPARITLGAERAHLVSANNETALGRRGVERLNPPRANSGSTRSPNQVSCRRQRKPSWSRIS